jgi:hypothetical protein
MELALILALAVLEFLYVLYGLLEVATTGLWRGGYLLDMNNGGGSRVCLTPR